MNILLTGGSGFIGKNIKEKLSAKYTILAPSHSEMELTDQAAVDGYFKSHQVDAVIHCAVKPGHRNAKNFDLLLKTDLQMYYNIVKNTEALNIKTLLLGSGCCYDMRNYRPKMKETDMGFNIPVDETGFAKYISSLHALSSGNVYDLRVFGIYGKHEDYSIRFISNAICKALFGLPITIKQNRLFDYVWIDDFVKILEIMLENDLQHHAYNITPDHSVSLYDLALLVRPTAGLPELPILIGSDSMGLEYSGDNSRLKSEFPDIEFTPHKKAVGDLYKWYKDHLHNIDRNCLLIDK